MKNFMGCLLVLIGIPIAGLLLTALAWIAYMLFHIVLYFLPVAVLGAIVLALPYLAFQFFKGFNS